MRWVTTVLARLTSFFLYSRVEVSGRARLPGGRPVLLVANHFNGLLDPVLLVAALGRTPRFLAKATLSKLVLVGWLLRACGVIFVHRQSDGAGTEGNVSAFAESFTALGARDTVVIFPEGTTHDRPHLERVRTGAARIALGARQAGVRGLVIMPVGMTFTDKIALRGDALVTFGDAIDLDADVAPDATDADAAEVEALTQMIEQRLRVVSPDFPDVETWLSLNQAAEVAARRPDRPEPPLTERAAIARRLTRAAPEWQDRVRHQVGRYTTVLAGLRIDDRDVVTPVGLSQLLTRALGTGLLVVLLGSLVGATIAVNAIPVGLVLLASLQVRRPVLKGTVRALVGLVAFPTTWFTAAALSVDGWLPILGLVAVFIAGAMAAVALLERTGRFVGSVLRWRLARERVATLADAAALRAEVLTTVHEALRSVPR